MRPTLIASFIAEFQRESQQGRLESLSQRRDAERRHAKVLREIDAIVSAITAGMFHISMKTKMDALEAERLELATKLQTLPEPEPIALHPGIADVYASKISDLVKGLNEPGDKAEAAEILRSLIERIILRPDEDAANGHVIELYGELGAILSLCAGSGGTNTKARTIGAGRRQVTMVAGAGFEPAAFRL